MKRTMLPLQVITAERNERLRPRRCDLPTCERSTREGKPYCSEHVEQHGYVQELLEKIAARDAEQRRVQQRGASAVDPAGLTSREILLQLELYGDRTVPRLARDLGLDELLVQAYAQALAKTGLVSLGHTRRNVLLVVLPQRARSRARRRAESAA